MGCRSNERARSRSAAGSCPPWRCRSCSRRRCLDSTVPFGVAALAACLLGTRLLREPRGARIRDPRLAGLGLALGLAALSRNEAIWIALAWAALAWWQGPDGGTTRESRALRARLVLVPAVVALVVVAPWLVRQAVVFGSPLPGQAITNAWAISGFEIFAWKDPATLAGYLAAGPACLAGRSRHRVLAQPAQRPCAARRAGRSCRTCRAGVASFAAATLRMLLVSAVATFAITTLVFPVQTTWGTYLHAAAPAHVLLIVSGLAGLDAGLAWVGRRRGWTRPVAWLGPLFAGAGAFLFLGLGIPSYGGNAAGTEARYAALTARFAALGDPLSPTVPVIANHPIWVAETNRTRALALPDEPVSSVLEIARTFGARYVVLDGTHGSWPARLATDPDARCLAPVVLPPGIAGSEGTPDFAVYRVACP